MKTGLFFGSFNPIHIGHLAIANYMVEFTDLEEVWLVVSPHNPLKSKEILISGTTRLAMVNLAIGNDTRIKTCDIELSLPQPSYTINTLNHLTEKYPAREFVIVMGADGLTNFDKWKCHDEISDKYQRYVYPRPGLPSGLLSDVKNGRIIDAPLMDISSTFIRESIETGKDVRYFVTSRVWDFIRDNQLYLTSKY